MPPPPDVPADAPAGASAVVDRDLLTRIMRRQAALSLRVAAAFVLVLAGLPLVNAFLPGLAAARVGGFTLSWLVLAVLFYPFTCLLSWLFVRESDRIEADIVARERQG